MIKEHNIESVLKEGLRDVDWGQHAECAQVGRGRMHMVVHVPGVGCRMGDHRKVTTTRPIRCAPYKSDTKYNDQNMYSLQLLQSSRCSVSAMQQGRGM